MLVGCRLQKVDSPVRIRVPTRIYYTVDLIVDNIVLSLLMVVQVRSESNLGPMLQD